MRNLGFLAFLLLCGCARIPDLPTANFPVPPPPDYAKAVNWAALPSIDGEEADRTPGAGLKDEQATAAADVFYVHPTIYFKTRSGNQLWLNIRENAVNRVTTFLKLRPAS